VCDQSVNGHKNYATWAVVNWISEDVNEIVDRIRAGEITRYEGMQELKAMIEDANPLGDKASMFSDILAAGLSDIDYYGLLEP
jgi:hypothetical protein